ncbi:MAG TPA: hypothetical protein P5076_18940, partial [Myxococcota bacterium]|nr:hypothetical protein [Myxococcota bacterium]
ADGRLVADDTPAALAARGSGPVVRLVVRAQAGPPPGLDELRARLSAVPGVAAVLPADGEGEGSLGMRVQAAQGADPRPGLFAAVVAAGLVLLDLHRESATLEDTFRRLTLGADESEGGRHA